MLAELEYHCSMRRLISATVAVFTLVMVALLAPAATAQINGVPASVSSIGFGGQGNRISGVPASVTSLGPNGFHPKNPFFHEPSCCINPLFPVNANPPQFQRHHHRSSSFFPVAVPVYTVPYEPMVEMQPVEDDSRESTEEDYRGGPTIFDRRGPGRPSYAEPARRDERAAEPASEPTAQAADAPVADMPDTVLVFKDGHQVEVRNYAVIGSTLYDLGPGHRRKIPLSELDLASTAKQNDERGIDFQVPASSETN